MNNSVPWISTQLSKAKYKQMTKREEAAMFARFRAGDKKARELIVMANLKFLASVASMYRDKGLALEDLIAEGSIGLNKAVDRFDPESGFKFITYAVWWIRQTILTALADSGRAFNVPSNRITVFNRVSRSSEKLFKELEREPTAAEISEASGIKESDVKEALSMCDAPLSLDWEDGEGMEHPMEAPGPLPDEAFRNSARRRAVLGLIECVSEKDQQILMRLYGLHSGQEETLEEIGDKIGCTREYVRQRKNKSIELIRQHARAGSPGRSLRTDPPSA